MAELTGPRPSDRHVAVIVSTMLPREHLSRHPLDAEYSRRMFTLFLKALDPMKMYFYQSDVDEFKQQEAELADKCRRGDVGPAYAMYARYLQRLDERVALVDQLLPIEPDFTLKETMVVEHDATTWATTPDEAKEKWRKRIKYDLLQLKHDTKEPLTGQAARDKLSRRYHSLSKRTHQTDADELLEMYLTAMTTAYDPHTNYMSPSSVDNFDILMRLDLDGIGASLQFNDGYTTVHKLIQGGAAKKDGRLKRDDKIVGVGQGESGPIVNVVDMKLSEVVRMIRGKRGTVVRLQVLTAGDPQPKVYAITREKVELKDSEAHAVIFDQGRKPDGTPYRIGVIDLPSFYMDMNGAKMGLANYRSTTRDVNQILTDFNSKGVDAVVLDLRHNGGGSLTEAINLTGLFITTGPVVQVKGADGRVQPYDDQDPHMSWSGPLVVLTSKLSASASEILAGAIQDYHRGLIVGNHATHGKGTVQSLLDLGSQLFRLPNAPQLGALKITVQQFYRPGGLSTQRRGVLADVELPSVWAHMDIGEVDLDYALPDDAVNAAPFQDFKYVDANIAGALSKRSADRVAASPDFAKENKTIAAYVERKRSKTVSLNEQDYLAEKALFNADKEEEKLADQDHTTIERDYYMNEVLAVTNDYLEELIRGGQMRLAGPPANAAPAPQ